MLKGLPENSLSGISDMHDGVQSSDHFCIAVTFVAP